MTGEWGEGGEIYTSFSDEFGPNEFEDFSSPEIWYPIGSVKQNVLMRLFSYLSV